MSRSAVVGLVAVVLAACSNATGERAATHGPATATPPSDSSPTSTLPPTTTAPVPASPEQVAAPADPQAMVEVLTRVERGLRTDDRDPRRLAALGWEQQKAYGTLLAHREWEAQVLAALPEDVRPVAEANLDAGKALTAPDLGPPLRELPDWTILVPKPVEVLVGFYREAEAEFGIRWEYLAAIHFVETKTGRIRGHSTAGAQGPMQFIPSTWAVYGEGDINDDHDAIRAAARYLAASGGPGNMDRALYAYNPSNAYVRAIQRYAGVIMDDPRAFDGYHAWQVYVATADGTHWLPEGWTRL